MFEMYQDLIPANRAQSHHGNFRTCPRFDGKIGNIRDHDLWRVPLESRRFFPNLVRPILMKPVIRSPRSLNVDMEGPLLNASHILLAWTDVPWQL